MTRTSTKPKKRIHSAAELVNDPSLRWCPYRYAEIVWSDSHGEAMRFLTYVGEGVQLATLNGIAPVTGTFPVLSIRRVNA